jgi:hypothetical protein
MKSFYLANYCSYGSYGKVRYPLKTPYRDAIPGDRGSHIIFEPLDFIVRLAALVPKARVNPARLDNMTKSSNYDPHKVRSRVPRQISLFE